jgi:hypothetical protein
MVRLIKSKRIRWTGLVTRRGGGEVYTGFRWENLRERDYLENLLVDGKIIVKWIVRIWNGVHGLD